MKTCIKCGVSYPDESMPNKKGRPSNVCRPCTREYGREWRRKQRASETQEETDGRRRRQKWYTTKQRCEKRGIPFNITAEYMESITPKFCPVFGFKLKTNDGRQEKDSCSWDRINPELGYVVGNMQVISSLANSMKQNATPEELLKFANWVLNSQS